MLEENKKSRIYSEFILNEISIKHKIIETKCGEGECGGDGIKHKL